MKTSDNQRNRKKVTSFDVAKEAGVSRSTVSVVLNNAKNVAISAETRARVLEVAERLQYKPNHAARAISTRTAYALGLVSCWEPSSPLFARPVQGMLEAMRGAGYALTLCDLAIHKIGGSIDLAVNFFHEGRIDGVIVLTRSFGLTSIHVPVVQKLRDEHIPFVLINSGIKAPGIDDVSPDNFNAGFLATEHLIKNGHRKIAFLLKRQGAEVEVHAESLRFKGYLYALEKFGIPFSEEMIIQTGYSSIRAETGYRAFRRFLETCSSPPTAVYAINDYLGIGAIAAAEEAGLRIPDDLAVVGTDDLDISSKARPTLSTVQQPLQEVGHAAARLLLAKILNDPTADLIERLHPCKLIVRQSSNVV